MIGPRFSWGRMGVYWVEQQYRILSHTWVGQLIVGKCPQTELYFDRGVLSSMMRGPLQTGLYISLVGHHLENEEEWGRLSCLRTVSW